MNSTAGLSNNYKDQTWPLFGLTTYLSPRAEVLLICSIAVSIGNAQ